MILIADSGSTKTTWCLMAKSGKASYFRTDGLNPFFVREDEIESIINTQLLPEIAKHLWIGPIEQIWFYGAGCTPEKCPQVADALARVFKKAKIEVLSDMYGAARALLGHTPGVACILGTGSNSCLFDGEKFTKSVPALGFILGDEGSGAVLGKRLVADILKNQLGEELKQLFCLEMNVTQADIIEHVYRQPMPNRYLASLSRFCANHIDMPAIKHLVYEHFQTFVDRNIKQYPANMPVGFVGSIAYFYRPILEQVLAENRIVIANILQEPIEGLKTYHAISTEI